MTLILINFIDLENLGYLGIFNLQFEIYKPQELIIVLCILRHSIIILIYIFLIIDIYNLNLFYSLIKIKLLNSSSSILPMLLHWINFILGNFNCMLLFIF